MNAKLIALFKQFPWLTALKDEIGNPSVVKVARLDTDSIRRWCGTITTEDDSYFMKGYFFNNNYGHGFPLGEIHPRRATGFRASLKRLFASSPVRLAQTIEEVVRIHPTRDEITDIVLFGHDLNHYGSLQLYVYRLPKGKTMSDLLYQLDAEQKKQAQTDAAKAVMELKAEMEQFS